MRHFYTNYSKNSFLLFFIFTFFIFNVKADWIKQSTGINDELTGVVVWGNNGLVSGHKGLYITTNGINGASNWSRFNISGNSHESLIYNQTKFYHAFSETISGNNKAFVCGEDTVNKRAVIFQISFPSLAFAIIYEGEINSSLKKITYSSENNRYYAVGDSGLMVSFKNSTDPPVIMNTGVSYDLTSISFDLDRLCIGTNNAFIYGEPNNSSGITFTVISTIGKNHKDVIASYSSTSYSVGNGYYSAVYKGASFIDRGFYDYGPLNANCMTLRSGVHLVGTDHGIFKSGTTRNFLELQPSTFGYHINCFWAISATATDLYACGKNGTLLLSTDNGGQTKPIALLSLTGSCENETKSISGAIGSSTNCKWLLNGVLVSNDCSGFSRTFNTIGSYSVELNVSNGSGYYDTAIQMINVVKRPSINSTHSESKKLLCKGESITITIDSSQQNVYYTLKSNGTTYGTSTIGNNGKLNFTTEKLNTSMDYFIQANSTLANCNNVFKDTISIKVEKPKANFHCNLINASTKDAPTFYSKSSNASNLKWVFHTPFRHDTSYAVEPSINFPSIDSVLTELICWTDSGCYDTLIAKGPNIYTEYNNPDSFYNIVNYSTPNKEHFAHPEIYDITSVKNGYLLSGVSWDSTILNSLRGTSLMISSNDYPNYFANYIAKYNNDGVLKWKIRLKGYYNQLLPIVEDPTTGDIYFASNTGGFFEDNSNVFLSNSSNLKNTLIKMDSMGRFIWSKPTDNKQFSDLSIDSTGNILGIVTTPKSGSGYDQDMRVIKFSLVDGTILWEAKIELKLDNDQVKLIKIAVDSSDNIYITSSLSVFADFYSRSGSKIYSLNGFKSAFIAKYNHSGDFQWAIKSKTISPNSSDDLTVDITGLVVDGTGNSYIIGKNGCYNYQQNHVFENTDSTTTTTNDGRYFIAKINNIGVCKWVMGGGAEGQNILLGNSNDILRQMNYDNNFNGYVTIIDAYDSLGGPKRRIRSEDNSRNLDYSGYRRHVGFIKKTNGAYFLAGHIRTTTDSFDRYSFGTITNPQKKSDASDAIVTKFYENWRPAYSNCNTFSSISVVQCDSFLAPSGKIYNETGTYEDIITNYNGCDSIITINLTLNWTKHPIHLTGCDSVSFRNITYLNTGVYQEVLTNYLGCDSIVFVHATVHKSSIDSIYVTVCDSFIYNNETYKNNGWYSFKYVNIYGCDSSVFIHLKVNHTIKTVLSVESCDNYTLNNITYDSSGTYTQTLISSNHCDSILILHLTINGNRSYLTLIGCDSITINQISYYSSGQYNQQLTNSKGCDSILVINLTINKSTTSFISMNGCDSIIVNGIRYVISGVYYQTLTNVNGCDSLIKLNLSITHVDNAVIALEDTLVANITGKGYQWINCLTGEEIDSATDKRFAIPKSGKYKVRIIDGFCIYDSDCYEILKTGIASSKYNDVKLSVFPNPNNGKFSLRISNFTDVVTVKITDILGKQVFFKLIQNGNDFFELKVTDGIYLIQVLNSDEKIIATEKLVISAN